MLPDDVINCICNEQCIRFAVLPRVSCEIVYHIELINPMLLVVQSCSYTKTLTVECSTAVKSLCYFSVFCIKHISIFQSLTTSIQI